MTPSSRIAVIPELASQAALGREPLYFDTRHETRTSNNSLHRRLAINYGAVAEAR
jgi:hypothetical protein